MPKVLRAMSAQARPAADWAQVKLSLLPAATNFKTESAIAGGGASHYFKSFHQIDLELDASLAPSAISIAEPFWRNRQ